MIDAQKLLGGLLRQTLTGGRRRRRRRRSGLGRLLGGGRRVTSFGGGLTGAAGMGLLGVAIAAYEHFSQKSGQPASAQPAAGAATPGAPRSESMPPPPPGPRGSTPPPPPAPSSEQSQKTAMLLIQGMIAAAHADGKIDADEERKILEQLGKAGMTLEERDFILKQMASPPDLESLAAEVDSAELAKQLYAVSLLAIEVDTEAESAYLAKLRARLNISEEEARQIREGFGDSE